MDGSSKQALMNGADIIVDHLVKQKVPYLFGLCGHGITGFMDAAFKAQNRIRTISTHHEQSAGPQQARGLIHVLHGLQRVAVDEDDVVRAVRQLRQHRQRSPGD